MNTAMREQPISSTDFQSNEMKAALSLQRSAFSKEMPVPAELRIDRLNRLIDLLGGGSDQLCDALESDFGTRSRHVSQLTDIVYSVRNARHARNHVHKWMRPSRRPLDFPLRLLGAEARVDYLPKGVVGIVSPWNFPVYLAMTPLAGALAAGNRAMIKPSELTPATSSVLSELIRKHFDADEVTVFTGGPETGNAFCSLPFDHLVFTGGGAIGKAVMHAAADNLVPVTLELGGKSPVIVGRSADIQQAAERILLGKVLNAGQICLAPDYVLVDRQVESELISALLRNAERFYPDFSQSRDYAAIINARHYARLQSYIEDAKRRGAEILTSASRKAPSAADAGSVRIMPFTIVRNAPESSDIRQHEIFGPLLPVSAFDRVDEAIAYINAHDRPLGLYYFGKDSTEEQQVLSRTISGGVTLNDVIFHVMQEDLPLGGIGGSGMGRYHGHEGFLEFSHARAIYRQPRVDIAGLLGAKPPFGAKLERYIRSELAKR